MAALTAIGGIVSALGSVASGIAANNAAEFEAQQLEAKGKEEFAASQRDAEAKRKEAQLVMSRQQALAASQGGSASDPTIVRLMTKTAETGDYNARTAMYGGISRQLGMNDSATGARLTGQANMFGSFLTGAASAIKGFG